MKFEVRSCILAVLLVVVAACRAQGKTSVYSPDDYTWTTQSENSSGSMPCGGGSIGLNVWVEDGDIMFYAQRSGAFDENNTLLKAGRFRLQFYNAGGARTNLSEKLSGTKNFRQTLHLAAGNQEINIDGVRVLVSVDVFHPLIRVTVDSKSRIYAALQYESWRYRDRPIRKMEFQQCSYKFGKVKGLKTTADSIVPGSHGIMFYHQNADSTVFDATAWSQGLQDYRDRMYNPIGRLISGGMMSCPDFEYEGTSDGTYASTDYRAWRFTTPQAVKTTEVLIALGDTQSGLDDFTKQIDETMRHNSRKDVAKSQNWWKDYWNRSYIQVGATVSQSSANAGATASQPSAFAANMARNYTLFRYMLGCNAYGKWPTKFNGGLFTFDPVYVDSKYPFTPDFRRWGGGTFTAQNQRLVYWPMLKTGDYDMLRPQLDFYARILPTAMLRANVYWGHGGAYFNEQIENFGLPNIDEYGAKRREGFDRGVEYNAWLEYTWDTALEFCQMVLNVGATASLPSANVGATAFDVSPYIPLVKQCLRFFDEHYQWQASRLGRKPLDGDGHLIIYPGSGCETFKMAYNPASTIAGLARVSRSLCDYLSAVDADSDTIAYYKGIADRIPPIPTRTINGHECIAPAQAWARINNRELPQLYPVFPWHFFGVGHDSLDIALNTWNYDPYVSQFKGITSWEQANIFAADLGLADEAFELNKQKLADGPFRFPAFWGPGHDWAPDHNWGGSGMIGLQEMLLQTDSTGKQIAKPSWRKDVEISYKLYP